jgi:N-acetyl-gamma-glutamyl-phosphate/LysW-gamma-L-alpha-aminoadipyl-6-phosphate reductase
VGGELLRILIVHPNAEISFVTSRLHAGEYIYRIHPNLRGLTNLQFENYKTPIQDDCDLVFVALPHGESAKIIPQLAQSGLKIIDLGADFRLKNPEDYEKWYGYVHPNPDLLEKFVYGVPEIHHDAIRDSQLVSCPGCMAVTAILALAPAVQSGLIENERIVIDAKIGSSGAGMKPSASTHHAERAGVVRPYKPAGHRHIAEIEQELSLLCGHSMVVSFSAHAVGMVRGVLCTCHSFFNQPIQIQDMWKMFRNFYSSAPFIRLVRDIKGLHRFPDPKFVVGSNFCDIGFEIDNHSGRLILLSASDNLMKGAAGSAVQCMNIMFDLEETAGLRLPAIHPV